MSILRTGFSVLTGLAIALVSGQATAENNSLPIDGPNQPHRTILVDSPCPGPTCDADLQEPFSKGKRIVYLNFDGVTLTRSNTDDDAKSGVSAIVNSSTEVIPPFNINDLYSTQGYSRSQIINFVVQDMQAIHNDFDMDFVTTRPTSGNYSMVVFGGSCSSVTGSGGCAGVALRDCGDYMPNNITFVFPPGLRISDLATTAAQEAAHAYGLGHTNDRDDVMYPTIQSAIPDGYGAGTIPDGSGCPETATYQDSWQVMMDTIGPRGQDVTPPTISITTPAPGAVLSGGEPVRASVSDASGVASVEFRIGNQSISTDTSAPYEFTFPSSGFSGDVQITIIATDTKDNTNFSRVSVYVSSGNETPCDNNDQCADNEECKDNICVPDNGISGELGDTCTTNEECLTSICATVGDESRCSQTCTGNDECPSGFECIAGTACWPAGDGGGEGGGCNVAGGSRGVLGLLALFGFVLIALRRERER